MCNACGSACKPLWPDPVGASKLAPTPILHQQFERGVELFQRIGLHGLLFIQLARQVDPLGLLARHSFGAADVGQLLIEEPRHHAGQNSFAAGAGELAAGVEQHDHIRTVGEQGVQVVVERDFGEGLGERLRQPCVGLATPRVATGVPLAVPGTAWSR